MTTLAQVRNRVNVVVKEEAQIEINELNECRGGVLPADGQTHSGS
jgi:hypothetical protein